MHWSSVLSPVTVVAISAILASFISTCAAYYQGRHVCSKVENRPVSKSYKRPLYKEDLGRTIYQTAYRVELVPTVVNECCPGWEKRSRRESSCMKAKCKHDCENGGECLAPDLCLCKAGFAGYKCHIDINECWGRNKCQQDCVNTPGSYKCACRHGFKLAEDGYSCDLCVSCTSEYKEMQEQIARMNQKITVLEEEKAKLEANLTSAFNAFTAEEVTSPKPLTTASSSSADSTQAANFKKRLESLSHQISGLEEKISYCGCSDYGVF